MTFFRFVHLENAYEFAEENDKPLCTYPYPLERTDSYERIRGQFYLLYIVQFFWINQI